MLGVGTFLVHTSWGLGAYPIKFFLKSSYQIFEQGKVTVLPLWE